MAKETEDDVAAQFLAALQEKDKAKPRGPSIPAPPARRPTVTPRPRPPTERASELPIKSPAHTRATSSRASLPPSGSGPSRPSIKALPVRKREPETPPEEARPTPHTAQRSRDSGSSLPAVAVPSGRGSGPSALASGASLRGTPAASIGGAIPRTTAIQSSETTVDPHVLAALSSRAEPVSVREFDFEGDDETPERDRTIARQSLVDLSVAAESGEGEGLRVIPRSELRLPSARSVTPPKARVPTPTKPPKLARTDTEPDRLGAPAPQPSAVTPTPPVPKRTVPPIRGVAAEQIVASIAKLEAPFTADGEAILDHRGRSPPIYQARNPRPSLPPHRRLHPGLNVVLGFVPGGRQMVDGQVVRGIAFLTIAVLALFPAISTAVGWSKLVESMRKLAIEESWLVLHTGIALASVFAFEGLRLASALESRGRATVKARIAATFLLPSIVVLIATPRVLRYAPAVFEGVWGVALAVAALAIAGSVAAAAPHFSKGAETDRRILIGGGIGIAVLATVLVLTVGGQGLRTLASMARGAGFTVLPEILETLAPGA